MATIIVEDKEVEVKDNSELMGPCQDAGIPFSCKNGVCGTCLIEVQEGGDNLSDLSPEEKAFGLDDTEERLACQCIIKDGEVRLKSAYT